MRGLRGEPGIAGDGRATKWLLVASGILGLLAALPGRVPIAGLPIAVGEASAATDFTAVVAVATVLGLVGRLLLVAAAATIRVSSGAGRSAKTAELLLAGVAVLEIEVVGVFSILPLDVTLQVAAFTWTGRVVTVGGAAGGAAFAWPWLAPRLRRAAAAVSRGHRRHVDSTP